MLSLPSYLREPHAKKVFFCLIIQSHMISKFMYKHLIPLLDCDWIFKIIIE